METMYIIGAIGAVVALVLGLIDLFIRFRSIEKLMEGKISKAIKEFKEAEEKLALQEKESREKLILKEEEARIKLVYQEEEARKKLIAQEKEAEKTLFEQKKASEEELLELQEKNFDTKFKQLWKKINSIDTQVNGSPEYKVQGLILTIEKIKMVIKHLGGDIND